MINVSNDYKKTCELSLRPESYITAKYGSFDKTLKSKIKTINANEQTEFSNINKLINETKTTNYNYISCEPNRVKLDGSFYFINDKDDNNVNENIAYWSSIMSDNNGNFEEGYYPNITITFDSLIDFTEVTLYFQEICSKFEVKFYNGSQLVVTRQVENNNQLTISTVGSMVTSKINKVSVDFKKTGIPYRYIKLNEFDFGTYKVFNRDEILDINIIDELSIDSSELSSNYLSLSISNKNGEYDILNPKNLLSLLQEKQEITVYHHLKVGSRYKEVPLGTFLLKDFKTNNQKLVIEAYDDTYFMNDIYYGSDFYENEEVSNILKDLFNYFNYTNYTIDEELEGIKLSGYIPNVSFREALRLIVEASCSVVNKTRYGNTYIFKTYDPVVKTYTRNLITKENPRRNLYNNLIDITQYNYTNRTKNTLVFSAEFESKSEPYRIVFNKYPIIPNTLIKAENNSNYEIVEASATSCLVKVNSATTVKLNATLIDETTTIQTKGKTNKYENKNATKNIKNRLITSSNLENVAEWKLGRKEVIYDFQTPVAPYIEVGDTCYYKTRFGTTDTFIPTRLEFTKSIMQNIEGE